MKKDNDPGGYMTLEASLIMPIVIYICLLIIYVGFYQYDRCIIMQDCYRIALRGSSTYKDDSQDVYNTAVAYLEQIKADKYITKEWEYNTLVQGQVVIKASGKYVMPFVEIIRLTGTDVWEIDLEVKSICINPAIILRMCYELQESKEKKEN